MACGRTIIYTPMCRCRCSSMHARQLYLRPRLQASTQASTGQKTACTLTPDPGPACVPHLLCTASCSAPEVQIEDGEGDGPGLLRPHSSLAVGGQDARKGHSHAVSPLVGSCRLPHVDQLPCHPASMYLSGLRVSEGACSWDDGAWTAPAMLPIWLWCHVRCFQGLLQEAGPWRWLIAVPHAAASWLGGELEDASTVVQAWCYEPAPCMAGYLQAHAQPTLHAPLLTCLTS